MSRLTRSTLCLLLLSAAPAALFGSGKLQGYAQIGGQTVLTSLTGSTVSSVRLCPGASVTPIVHGTSTAAPTYSDEALTQPNGSTITANSRAEWSLYAADGDYDLQFSGCGSAWTLAGLRIGSGGGTVFNVVSYGAKGDLRTVTDGAITSGQATFVSSTAAFVAADIGKQIQIAGAGIAGATLYTTISAFTSASQVTLTLAASTAVSGATTKFYTDDGAAITAAATALASTGHGTLYFPGGTYGLYGKGTSYGILWTFTNLNNVNLICDGCQLYFSGEHTVASSGGSVFQFSGTSNVTIDGFDVLGEVTAAMTQTGTFHGVVLLHFLSNCTNINIPRLRATSILAPIVFNNNTGGLTFADPHSRNIHVGLLEANTCVYGINSQFSGDDMVVDMLKTDTVTRSLYIYGTANITANIHSRNAWGNDVYLAGFDGHGVSNVKINYASDATSTARSNSGAAVELDYFGTVPITHRNIDIHYDMVYPGSGTNNTGSSAFKIAKYSDSGSTFDQTDRGHVLDGLTLSGRIENYPNNGGYGIIEVASDSRWGATLDSWYNIQITNLHLVNTKFSRLSLRSLKGPLLLSNVTSDNDFILQQDDCNACGGLADTGFPQAGLTKIINSSFVNLWTFNGGSGALPSGVVFTSGNVNVPTGWQDQTINNSGSGGTTTATLPPAVIGRSYSFNRSVANAFRMAPQAADQIRGSSAANKYISMDVTGDTITITCNQTGFWDVRYNAPAADFSFQP